MVIPRLSFVLTGLSLSVISMVALFAETPPAPTPVVTADMKDGKIIFQNVCAACHGINGEGKPEFKSPAIAGLPDWYALSQLTSFRAGRRGHDATDAQAFLMAVIAKSLTPEQSKAVIDHTAKLTPPLPATIADADIESGRMLFQERCMECHRYNASGEIVFGSPPLIGQPDWYLTAQIQKFKNGQRGTIQGDVNGGKMVLAVNVIDSEQTMRDLVAYILTLNPPAVKDSSPFEAATR